MPWQRGQTWMRSHRTGVKTPTSTHFSNSGDTSNKDKEGRAPSCTVSAARGIAMSAMVSGVFVGLAVDVGMVAVLGSNSSATRAGPAPRFERDGDRSSSRQLDGAADPQ